MSPFAVASACVFLVILGGVRSLNNGLSRTPPMGFNTWNSFNYEIREDMIKEIMAKFVELGLPEAGYTHFNLDDCWQAPQRSPVTYALEPHPDRFPSGIAALAELAHSYKMKFGIYSDAGFKTCEGFPGSLGFETLDAQTFASWGVDYLKYDNCWGQFSQLTQEQRYTAMRDALNNTGRPIIFSMCSWGKDKVWEWADHVGNSWRTTDDIQANWKATLACLDGTVGLAKHAGPGGWNDPDMLEVGKLASHAEDRSHFAIWSLLKSPLLIGADVRIISPAALSVLKNRAIIAVNQDPLGVAGDLIAKLDNGMVFAGPLAGGARVVIMLNRQDSGDLEMEVTMQALGYPDDLNAQATELYSNATYHGGLGSAIGCVVGPHDVCVLRLDPVNATRSMDSWRPWGSGYPATCSRTATGGLACGHPKAQQVSLDATSLASTTPLVFRVSTGQFTFPLLSPAADLVYELPAVSTLGKAFAGSGFAPSGHCAWVMMAAAAALVLAAMVALRAVCLCACRRNAAATAVPAASADGACCSWREVVVMTNPLRALPAGEAGLAQPLLRDEADQGHQV